MITHDYYELFQDDSIDKQLIIETSGGFTIGNEDIFSESMEATESLCSETQLTFGPCEASSFKIKIANIMSPLIGQWLTVSYKLNGNDTKFPVGKYKVFSDTPTADRKWREIVAYDSMHDILNTDVADWYNSVLPNADSTTTLRKFRDSFFSYFGIAQETATLVNDSMTVEQTISPSELSGKDVITAICEINGVLGHITRNGTFKYIKLEQYIEGLYPANDLYPSDDLFPRDARTTEVGANGTYISCTYEDYVCKGIDKLQIRKEENDIGAIVGTGDNCYIIEDNFLVYGKNADDLDTIANNVLDVVKGLQYRPFTAEIKGNLCLEVGDAVRLATKYEIIESYILQRTLKGIQALRDTFTTEGEEERSEKVNSVNKQIIELKGKTNTLVRNVEETQLKIEDTAEKLSSTITQTASSITEEVLKARDTYDLTGYDIKYQGLGTPSKLYASTTPQVGEYYLDANTGKIYRLTKVTSTDEEYYYNVEAQFIKQANLVSENLSTKIETTADSITQSLLSTVAVYDYAGYDIRYYGLGTPDRLYSETAPNVGDYYLDTQTGKLYTLATVKPVADNNLYYEVTYTEVETLPTTSETLSNEIRQTAEGLKQEILKTTDTWYLYDDKGDAYNVKYQGIGADGKIYPDEDEPQEGDLYLDSDSGLLYTIKTVAYNDGDEYYTVTFYPQMVQLEKTSTTLSNQITNSADGLKIEISETYETKENASSTYTPKSDIVTTINADASGIKINTDKMDLTTSGWSILSNGNFSLGDGALNYVNGEKFITLKNGLSLQLDGIAMCGDKYRFYGYFDSDESTTYARKYNYITSSWDDLEVKTSIRFALSKGNYVLNVIQYPYYTIVDGSFIFNEAFAASSNDYCILTNIIPPSENGFITELYRYTSSDVYNLSMASVGIISMRWSQGNAPVGKIKYTPATIWIDRNVSKNTDKSATFQAVYNSVNYPFDKLLEKGSIYYDKTTGEFTDEI